MSTELRTAEAMAQNRGLNAYVNSNSCGQGEGGEGGEGKREREEDGEGGGGENIEENYSSFSNRRTCKIHFS